MRFQIIKSNSVRFFNILFLLLFFINSFANAQESVSENRKNLLKFLSKTYQKKLVLGQKMNVHTPLTFNTIGLHPALQSHDIKWVEINESFLSKYKQTGSILELHWHWHLGNDSAWKSKRQKNVSLEKIFKKGTDEQAQFKEELKKTADKLEFLKDNGVVLLWRPFHEMDGDWFWWSDQENPSLSRKLWLAMYKYFVEERKLTNLIWVYSISSGFNKKLELRKKFYPGDEYVDIVGVDAYDLDAINSQQKLDKYKSTLDAIAPRKYHALTELDNIPRILAVDPDSAKKWLYIAPWWGAPSPQNELAYNIAAYNSEHTIHLAQLPDLWTFNSEPLIGIVFPIFGRSFWNYSSPLALNVVTKDFEMDSYQIDLAVNNILHTDISLSCGNVLFYPNDHDVYKLKLIARNEKKNISSNEVFVVHNLYDITKFADFKVSSNNEDFHLAIDKNLETSWISSKEDHQVINIKFERKVSVDKILLHWGWKIHPKDFDIYVKHKNNWKLVFSERNSSYVHSGKTHYVQFPVEIVKEIKLVLAKRAGNQNWGGYNLQSIEIPVERETYEEVGKAKRKVIFAAFAIIFVFFTIFLRNQRKVCHL